MAAATTRNDSSNNERTPRRMEQPFLLRAFFQKLGIYLGGMVVGFLGFGQFLGRDFWGFLAPALLDAAQTPLGAGAGCSDRLATYDNKNRIRMRRRKDSHGNPTALRNWHG